MNLRLQIAKTVLVGSGVTAVAVTLRPPAYWMVVAVVAYGCWRVTRDIHLSRWRVAADETGIKVGTPCGLVRSLPWEDLCRAQRLQPDALLPWARFIGQRQLRTGPEPWRSRLFVPLGMNSKDAWRRLWTLSSDLLLQLESAEWALFPLGALDAAAAREVWALLRQYSPRPLVSRDLQIEHEAAKRGLEAEQDGERQFQQRQWAEARDRFSDAANAWTSAGIMECAALSLRWLADSLLRLGEYTAARGAAVRALRMVVHLDDAVAEAHILNQLSEASLRIGGQTELRHALDYVEQARAIYGRMHERFMACRMLSNKAIIYQQLVSVARSEECDSLLSAGMGAANEALRILRHELDAGQGPQIAIQEANVLGSLGRFAFLRGEWQQSFYSFEEARTIGERTSKSVFVEDMAMWGRALALWAAAQDDGTAKGSISHVRCDAINKLEAAVRTAQLHGDYSERLQVHAMRGDTFWDWGNMPAAVRDYETVIGLLEVTGLAGLVPGRAADRVGLLRHYRAAYVRATEGLLRMADSQDGQQDSLVARAFLCCERHRARHLSELLGVSGLLASLPPDLRSRLEDASGRLRLLGPLQLDLETADQDAERTAWERIAAAQRHYEQVLRDLAERGCLRDAVGWAQAPQLHDVVAALPEDGPPAAVLSFMCGESGICVFLLMREVDLAETCFVLPDLGQQEIAKRFLQHGFLPAYDRYVAARSDRKRTRDEVDSLWWSSMQAAESVIAQLRSDIVEMPGPRGRSVGALLRTHAVQRLAIIPDGVLHRLPLHAAFRDIPEVTVSPSCSVLLSAAQRLRARHERALVVACGGGGRDSAVFAQEARDVAAELHEQGVEVLRLDEDRASPDAVVTSMAGRSLFHFCGHAEASTESVMDSHLSLSGGESLRVREIVEKGALEQGACVVLNGCETGIASDDPIGQWAGLPSAFLTAGASTVVSTMWPVDLDTPMQIMREFYARLAGTGRSYGTALREAIDHVIGTHGAADLPLRSLRLRDGTAPAHGGQSVPRDHPFFWAPYVTYGASWHIQQVPISVAAESQVPYLGSGVTPAIQGIVEEANTAVRGGLYQQAVVVLEKALTDLGPSIVLHERLREACAQSGDLGKAREHARSLVAVDPNSHAHWYNLGRILADSGQVHEARESYMSAISLSPDDGDILAALITLSLTPGEAARYVEALRRTTPSDPDLQRHLEVWQRLITHSPEELAGQRVFWAEEAVKRKEYGIARCLLALVQEADISGTLNSFAWRTESDILRHGFDDIPGSVRALEEAVRADPSIAPHWNTLAARRYLLARSPALTQAEQCAELERAKSECLQALTCGDYSKMHQNLAAISLAMNQVDRARQEALVALGMAERQLISGSGRFPACRACPSEEQRDECQQCFGKAQRFLKDIELLGGSYGVASPKA